MIKILKGKGVTIFSLFLIILAITIIAFQNITYYSHVKVKINNNTNSNITGLNIYYVDSKKKVSMPNLESKADYNIDIKHKSKDECEAIFINYLDKEKNENNITLVGYIEKGYSGDVNVDITDIDENGIIDMKINSNINVEI